MDNIILEVHSLTVAVIIWNVNEDSHQKTCLNIASIILSVIL